MKRPMPLADVRSAVVDHASRRFLTHRISSPGRAFRQGPTLRVVGYRANTEFITRAASINDFGVDAVLAADLGRAPHVTRQHSPSG